MNIDELPAPASHWKAPIPHDNGDATADSIYTAVGRVTSAWEQTESGLLDLFALLIQSYSPAAKRAYGAIASFRGRLDVLIAAADTCFLMHNATENDRRSFNQLTAHLAAGAGRRNEIVHGHVYQVGIQDRERGCFLCPASYNTNKNSAKAVLRMSFGTNDEFGSFTWEYRYTSADIDYFRTRLASLWGVTLRFYEHLIEAYPRMYELASPPLRPAADTAP